MVKILMESSFPTSDQYFVRYIFENLTVQVRVFGRTSRFTFQPYSQSQIFFFFFFFYIIFFFFFFFFFFFIIKKWVLDPVKRLVLTSFELTFRFQISELINLLGQIRLIWWQKVQWNYPFQHLISISWDISRLIASFRISTASYT